MVWPFRMYFLVVGDAINVCHLVVRGRLRCAAIFAKMRKSKIAKVIFSDKFFKFGHSIQFWKPGTLETENVARGRVCEIVTAALPQPAL